MKRDQIIISSDGNTIKQINSASINTATLKRALKKLIRYARLLEDNPDNKEALNIIGK